MDLPAAGRAAAEAWQGVPLPLWLWSSASGLSGEDVDMRWQAFLGEAGPARAPKPSVQAHTPAAYRQNSRIRGGGVGSVIATWVSRMDTVPVDGVMCAAVPVPPTQP